MQGPRLPNTVPSPTRAFPFGGPDTGWVHQKSDGKSAANARPSGKTRNPHRASHRPFQGTSQCQCMPMPPPSRLRPLAKPPSRRRDSVRRRKAEDVFGFASSYLCRERFRNARNPGMREGHDALLLRIPPSSSSACLRHGRPSLSPHAASKLFALPLLLLLSGFQM